MTVRPIDMQVVLNQQSTIAGHEQSQQNVAAQVKAQDLQKIPDKTHERETQVEKQGESNQIRVKEKEAERKKKRGRDKPKGDKEDETDTEQQKVKEDGKGVQLDVTT